MEITKEVFESFLLCPYKAHRILRGESGNKSEFELIQNKISEIYHRKALEELYSGVENNKAGDKVTILRDQRISAQGLSSLFNVIESVPGKSALGSFHYTPMLFTPHQKPTKEETAAAAFDSLVLEGFQG